MSTAAAWNRRADALAGWTMANLVNRVDVWGAYLPERLRETKARADGTTFIDKTRTAPAVKHRGRVTLTEAIVAAHYRGEDGCLIGLHATGQDNRCRWGAIDVDRHEGDGADAWANLRAMLHWRDKLLGMGFDPTLTESNGDGGYHLRILFDTPVPAPRLYVFLQDLIADHGAIGLATKPETFPKQPALPAGKYGNWLRLFGRHHSRDHWTRLCVGSEWVEGADAADLLLEWRPDSPDLIPPPTEAPAVRAVEPKPRRTWDRDPADDRELALRCLDAIRNADEYHQWVHVGMALHSVDEGRGMLAEWVAWSRQSGKFTDGECERKWVSFSARRDRPVTLGTLVHLARQGGADVGRKGRAA